MIRNYLVTAFRNFRKNKFYVMVNVLGLSIGITCCLVVYTILKHELTFDNFHNNSENIYRLVEHYVGDDGIQYGGIMPNAMGFNLDEKKSAIKEVITMHGPVGASMEFTHNKKKKAFIEEDNILFANPAFLNNLNFSILQGAPSSSLGEPFKVYLTEKIAKKYFGNDNPIGQFITFDEKHDLEVVGIMKDTPTNTNVYFEILISYPTILEWNGSYVRSWNSYWAGTVYVVVDPSDDLTVLQGEVHSIAYPNFSERKKQRNTYHFQPLSEVHTDTRFDDGVRYVAPTEVLIGFILLAVITLVASILNFINLATAQAVQRSKEVGIRKTLGSSRAGLMTQFIGETFIIVLISCLLAFTIGQVFIDKMNGFLAIVNFQMGYDFTIVVFAILLCVVVSLLAGFYPSVVLANYNPITALQNRISIRRGSGKMSLRKTLVITQFVIANLLIITTIIVASQMTYIKKKDLGFDRENIVLIEFPERSRDKIELVKNALLDLSFIHGGTHCMSSPISNMNWNTAYHISGKTTTDRMSTNVKFIDSDYLELYEIPLIAGRNLDDKLFADSTHKLVVNREFLKRGSLPLDSAIGVSIKFLGERKGKIVGVVEDFHVSGLQEALRPVIMLYEPDNMGQINIRLSSNNFGTFIPEIENVFRKFAGDEIFMATFLSDIIKDNYILENLVYGVFQIFSVMAILIGIFGLYGLVSFMANRNRKNISIRKVFGAHIFHILGIFGKEYLILLFVSFFLAIPAAYFLSQEWLNGFEYRIPITPIYFVMAILISLLITIGAVGYRSFQAATSNPIDSLRYE